MKFYLFCVLFFLSLSIEAAPFIESDVFPTTSQKPTHCSLFLDSATTGVDSPVVTDTTGTYCKNDIGSISSGAHSAKLKAVIIDTNWGRQESGFSTTINFTKPAAPTAPASLIISPN